MKVQIYVQSTTNSLVSCRYTCLMFSIIPHLFPNPIWYKHVVHGLEQFSIFYYRYLFPKLQILSIKVCGLRFGLSPDHNGYLLTF